MTNIKNEKNTGTLRDKFIEPPFTILDARSGNWQKRKEQWLALGIQSELGRNAECQIGADTNLNYMPKMKSGTSIFDPALCELMYHWFCPLNGLIGDIFAGGSVRGIVAHKMGFKYTGIELSAKQVEANIQQAREILPPDNQPHWSQGDSNKILDTITDEFDMIFSCPPYANLEVYSEHPDDISNMIYSEFLLAYRSIIKKAVNKLKNGHFAVFVVGDVRDTEGYYLDFISHTKQAFIDAGAGLYNEAILLDPIGTAMIRANNNFSSKKLVKVHQNVLCFKKGGNPNALNKKIIVDYITKCDCGGRIRRLDGGKHMCENCMKEYIF